MRQNQLFHARPGCDLSDLIGGRVVIENVPFQGSVARRYALHQRVDRGLDQGRGRGLARAQAPGELQFFRYELEFDLDSQAQGVTAATTPTGSLVTMMRLPSAWVGMMSP